MVPLRAVYSKTNLSDLRCLLPKEHHPAILDLRRARRDPEEARHAVDTVALPAEVNAASLAVDDLPAQRMEGSLSSVQLDEHTVAKHRAVAAHARESEGDLARSRVLVSEELVWELLFSSVLQFQDVRGSQYFGYAAAA